jgi:hypothetical protein
VLVLHLGRSDGCDVAEEVRSVAEPWFENYDVLDDEPRVPRPLLIGRAVGPRISRSRRVGRVRGPTR